MIRKIRKKIDKVRHDGKTPSKIYVYGRVVDFISALSEHFDRQIDNRPREILGLPVEYHSDYRNRCVVEIKYEEFTHKIKPSDFMGD